MDEPQGRQTGPGAAWSGREDAAHGPPSPRPSIPQDGRWEGHTPRDVSRWQRGLALSGDAVSPRLGGKHREEPAVAGSSERAATASRAVGVRGAGWALAQRVRVRAGARPGKRPQQSRGWRGPGEPGTPALAVSACDGVAVAVAWGPGPQEKLRTERPRGRQPHSGVCPRTRNRSLRARSAPRVHHCAATAQAPAAAGGTRTQDVRATEYYSALKKVEGLAACNGCMNLEAVMPREVGHRRRRKAARHSSNEDIKRPNPGAREHWVPEAVGGGWGVSLGGPPFQPRDKGGVSERSFPPVPRSL